MKYVLLILFTALVFGRPVADQHKKAIADKVAKHLSVEADDMVYAAASGALLDKHVVMHDFYLFTVAEVHGQVLSVGALRLVYVRTEILTLKLLML
jgi:hypothetical protein